MYELIAELIFLRNQQPADTQGIPPIWQKLVRPQSCTSRSPVQQALIYTAYKKAPRISWFSGLSCCSERKSIGQRRTGM